MAKADSVLDNKTRRMIYNHILNYPGVPFNTLKNIFELTDGGLRYHLDYLEKHEKISSGLDKGDRCYYPHYNSINNPNRRSNPSSSGLHKLNSNQERLLGTIKRNPGINQKELIHQTRLNRDQVAKNVNKLYSLNLVKKYRNDRNVCYEYMPDDELKFVLMKRLVIKLLRDEIDEETFLKLKRRLGA